MPAYVRRRSGSGRFRLVRGRDAEAKTMAVDVKSPLVCEPAYNLGGVVGVAQLRIDHADARLPARQIQFGRRHSASRLAQVIWVSGCRRT